MKPITSLYILFSLIFLGSCHRADEEQDVLSQEEISNIILLIKDDATGLVQAYNYTANAIENPKIPLTKGKTYTVDVVFKNGNENINSEILDAKDEHFILFQVVGAQVDIQRLDGAGDLRSDGNRVGMKTHWKVNDLSSNGKILLTLNHAAVLVSEAQNNSTFGVTEGGEVDAEAVFDLLN